MKMTNKVRRGRPPKGANKIKAFRLDMRLDGLEKDGFRTAAELSGLDLSTWVRERLRLIARDELQQAGMDVPFLIRAAK